MVDHKVIEVGEEWIKVDKDFERVIQSHVDDLIVAAKMLDYEVTTQYMRKSETLTGVFLYLSKENGDSNYRYKLDFLMNGDLRLKQIRLALNGLGDVAVGGVKNGFVEPIKRLKEML